MSQPTELEHCAQAVMETLPRVMHLIRAEMRRHGSPALSVPQFRALTYLNRHAGAALSDVANHLGVTPATASAMVERLVQNGFVDRVADPQERRRSVLTLTALGTELLQSAREATRRRVAESISVLSESQVAELTGAMSLLNLVFKEVSAHDQNSR